MTVIHGFELVREQSIPELNTHSRLFRHVRTGAQLLSMENDDENKSFGISFVTPPATSNGIAHIMEHSVLCGSRKYPLKEPFVELLKGSLKTFLNALTFPDKTSYPVASQNTRDFYNLIDVYLDAVFYPRITPQTLQQEGWHYELENVDDPLSYKGVVFNEMKGAYSSPDNLLGRFTQQSLFPDNTYGVDSGGDPAVIPDLTYAEFKQFHDTYYHPSNSYIYFYGDDDADTRLKLIDDFLVDFDQLPLKLEIPLQARFDQPSRMTFGYDAGEEAEGDADKGFVQVNWLLAEATDTQTMLALRILSHILSGTSASPLRKALIESELGEDFIGGLETEIRQSFYSAGLRGVAVDTADKVEALILDTLRSLADQGIDREMVEASLNTIEFRLRENNTGSFPRGLALMFGALSSWLYGGDPAEALAFEGPLNAIKAAAAEGQPFFEGLIRQYLLDNTHRTTLLMKPDPEIRARREEAERDRLALVRDAMSRAELEAVIETTHALKQAQETPDSPEALATIPTLTLDDLDKTIRTIPVEADEAHGVKIYYHNLFTNGISYVDAGFDLHVLPQEDIPYVPLFCRSLTSMGTETEDYVKLSRRIGRKTGGLGTSPIVSSTFADHQSAAWILMRGKGTVAQTGDLLQIARDVLLTAKLDNPTRFKQMVLENKASLEAGLVPGGHGVAGQRLRAQFDEADWVSEQMGGVTQIFFLRELVEQVDNDWPSVLARLEAIRSRLLNRAAMIVNVTLDEANWQTIRPLVVDFIGTLPATGGARTTWTSQHSEDDEGLTIPAQVNYVAKGGNLYDHGYTLNGSVSVVTNYLRTTYLWDRIRVQGGAYGGFCTFDQRSGVFTFVSYRDPNLAATIDNYDKAGSFLKDAEVDESELTRNIIGAIGSMDAYQLPDAKGMTSLVRILTGETDERRQKIRNEVLATSNADFKVFGAALERLSRDGQVVVVGSAKAIEEANSARPGWLKVTKVL